MGFSFSRIFGNNDIKPSVQYAFVWRCCEVGNIEKTSRDLLDRVTDYMQQGYKPLGGIQTTALSDGKILLTQSLSKTA